MSELTVEKGSLELTQASQEIFRKFLPNAEISSVDRKDIPPNIWETFEERSKLYIDPKDRENILSLFLITHSNGDRTYVAQQRKTYPTNLAREELSYFIDTGQNGEIMGISELRKSLSDQGEFFKDKPFVGYTETLVAYRRRGLGLRRLLAMNAVSQMTYGLPLHSSNLLSRPAEKVWSKLAAEGKARKYKEGISDRYSFLS